MKHILLLIVTWLHLISDTNSKCSGDKKTDKSSKKDIKISRGNFEANLIFLNRTGLLTKDRNILEIGSGKGALVSYLSKKGYRITGTDISLLALRVAVKNDPQNQYLGADGFDLPFKNNTFDLVLSFDVFEHIPDTDKHLEEVKRVLKPNGYYLVQTPNKWTNAPFEIIKEKSLSRYKEYHSSLHNYWQLKRRFEKNGFNVRFYDIPVVNDFFRAKIKRQFGKFSLKLLSIFNPDRFPYFLKTNFYMEGKLER